MIVGSGCIASVPPACRRSIERVAKSRAARDDGGHRRVRGAAAILRAAPGGRLERIRITASAQLAHRLPGTSGDCRFVHGATWRGTIVVAADELPRDPRDVTLAPEALMRLLTQFDHRLVITCNDPARAGEPAREEAGVVVIAGRAPTAEALTRHVVGQVEALLRARFAARGQRYVIEVTMLEDEDGFAMTREVLI